MCASEPYVAKYEAPLDTEKPSHHPEFDVLDTRSSAYHMVVEPNKQDPPPNDAKRSTLYRSTALTNAVQGEYTPLTQQTLHHHSSKNKSSPKDKTEQYVRSQHRTHASIPSPNVRSKVPHHPCPTFISEIDVEQPEVHIHAEIEPRDIILWRRAHIESRTSNRSKDKNNNTQRGDI
jgi:hypothetical protein